MLHKLSSTVYLLALLPLVFNQVVLPGRCPQVKVMTEFNLERYTGLWYQYSMYPNVWETGYKCVSAKYGDLGNGTLSVQNRATDSETGKPYLIEGYAKVLGPATLAVVFFDGQSEREANYQVLDTDYTRYAVVYSCSKHPLNHVEFLWILTRYRIPSEETIKIAQKVIDKNGLSQTFLTKTEQEDCSPVIDPDAITGYRI